LIVELEQSILGNPAYKKLTTLGQYILDQTRTLRVIYISYSFLGRRYHDTPLPGEVHRQTTEEMIAMSDQGKKVALGLLLFNKPLESIRKKD